MGALRPRINRFGILQSRGGGNSGPENRRHRVDRACARRRAISLHLVWRPRSVEEFVISGSCDLVNSERNADLVIASAIDEQHGSNRGPAQ